MIIQRTLSAGKIKESTEANHKKVIPLSDVAYEIVKEYTKDKLPEAWLFVNPDTSNHYNPKKVAEAWRKHTGLDISFNEATRHSYGTFLGESGASEYEIQKLMRHEDVRSAKHYVHMGINDRLRQLVDSQSGTS